jgi:hypothetical protein
MELRRNGFYDGYNNSIYSGYKGRTIRKGKGYLAR